MLTLLMIYYRNIKVGDPEDSNNMLGALNTKEHLAKVCLTHYLHYQLIHIKGSVLC